MTERQKVIRTVYLSGAMDYLSEEEAKKDRMKAEKILDPKGIDVFNPFRKPIPPEGVIQRREIVLNQDLRMIDESDAILVNATHDKINCWGTAGEALYAYLQRKPVIAYVGERKTIPLWLSAEAECITRTLEDACQYIINYNRRKIDTDKPSPVKVKDFIEEDKKK